MFKPTQYTSEGNGIRRFGQIVDRLEPECGSREYTIKTTRRDAEPAPGGHGGEG